MSQSSNRSKSLIVKSTLIKILGCVVIGFFLLCALMAWRAGQGRTSPATQAFVVLMFLTFVALGVYLLLSSGALEVDDQRVTYRSVLAVYRMNWSEISYIEIDSRGSNIVFCGEHKRVAALGPMWWSGNKNGMLGLLGNQVDKAGIEIRQTEKANYRRSKNTKMHA